jgi:uncharacterized protein (DUF2147 family)
MMMMKLWHHLAYAMASLITLFAPTLCRGVFLFTVWLFSPLALSADIDGIWKHAEEPVWIEIRLDQSDGVVLHNDKFPERVGNTFIKDITADKSTQGLWRGSVYIPKLKDYKNVEMSLSETGTMQIIGSFGFFSRTIEWLQVDKLPVQ